MSSKREEKMKEIITMIIILILIFGGSFITKKYLAKTTEEILSNLEDLKQDIVLQETNKDSKKIMEASDNIKEMWKKTSDMWGIIVLHNELDLIETSLIKMEASIKMGEYSEALEGIENSMFLINHINEKEKLSLKNIF